MKYDVIVLGGGPGGYLAAERAGQGGLKTLLIERDKLGGVCLNEGCIPTKTLLHSAKIYHYMTESGKEYGVRCEHPSLDHAFIVERKNRMIKMLASGVAAALKGSHVDVVTGEGIFTGREEDGTGVLVNGELHEGKRIVIATGSETVIPPIQGLGEGLKKGFVLTNKEILNLKEVPQRLVIVGGGVIGLEMAVYFQCAGSRVFVIDRLSKIAGGMDTEISDILQRNLAERGIEFYLDAAVKAFETDAVVFESAGTSQRIECDKALISVGRRARTQGFGLENLHVLTGRDGITIDNTCLTNIPNIYAVGDCNGKTMLAHGAYRQAEVAVNSILGKKDIMRYDAIPSVIYTDPEVATLGLTEEKARERGIGCTTVKIPMNYAGRYMVENEHGYGICKLVFHTRHKTLIGAHILGGPASEFITSCGIMIETEMTVDSMKELVFPHPTVCEIIREAIFRADI